MNKTTYYVAKMDCPSEEQLIRMKLAGNPGIEGLQFDIANRKMTVLHTGDAEPISRALADLRLDSRLLGTEDAGMAELTDEAPNNRRVLIIVLGINIFFTVLEIVTGLISGSMGLVADSLDMLADALVYGLALYAVGRAVSSQKQVARLGGYFQLALAFGGLMEVVRRFVGVEEVPHFGLMMGISFLALLGNSISLYLLRQSKSEQVHMQASMIFTSVDVIANIGVIVAGGLVYLTGSALPDLIVGLIVFVLVAQGAMRIFRLSR